MLRVEQVMGLPVAIDVRDPGVSAAAIDAAFLWLRRVDLLFSTYRGESEIARINRGELRESDAQPDVRGVLAACRALRDRTGGAFDAEAAARTTSATLAEAGRRRASSRSPASGATLRRPTRWPPPATRWATTAPSGSRVSPTSRRW